jgi:hypothetical protein
MANEFLYEHIEDECHVLFLVDEKDVYFWKGRFGRGIMKDLEFLVVLSVSKIFHRKRMVSIDLDVGEVL